MRDKELPECVAPHADQFQLNLSADESTSLDSENLLNMIETPDVPRNSDQEKVIPVEPLIELVVKFFVRKGMFEVEAEMAAKRLVESDLRGVQSHGTRRVKLYLDAMDTGDIDPRAAALTIFETPAMAVMEGSRGLGPVGATKAMQLAIKKAREVGTGTVAVKKGHHFGAAAVYVQLAIEAGMIGFCTTSTGPATVAAYGSKQPATANNAFAWGAPVREGAPFILDMSCARSSWGKIESLGLYGEMLPDGWALDGEGNATNDPAAAKTLFPAAGARGFGLAFLCSILAGPLVGRKMPLHKTRSPMFEASDHFFYAIDIEQFGEPDRFYSEMESTMSEIREMPPEEGFDKVRLPGEMEWERAQQWKEQGVPLHLDHVKMLEEIAASMKYDVPW